MRVYMLMLVLVLVPVPACKSKTYFTSLITTYAYSTKS